MPSHSDDIRAHPGLTSWTTVIHLSQAWLLAPRLLDLIQLAHQRPGHQSGIVGFLSYGFTMWTIN